MKKCAHLQDDALEHLDELKAKHPKAWANYELGLESFKISVLLKQLREEAGFSQEQLAKILRISKQAVSKFENHSEDIRLSTLQKIAAATGHKIALSIKVERVIDPIRKHPGKRAA